MFSNIEGPLAIDYEPRTRSLQKAMKIASIDALLISNPDDYLHYSGLENMPSVRLIILVILQQGTPAFISPHIEASIIIQKCSFPIALDWIEWDDGMGHPTSHRDAVVSYLDRVHPEFSFLGVDCDFITANEKEAYKQQFGADHVVDISTILADLRLIKDEAFIKTVGLAADVAVAGFCACAETVAAGKAEGEVACASRIAVTKEAAKLWG
jgi:Xaa-Pro dipeptidase